MKAPAAGHRAPHLLEALPEGIVHSAHEAIVTFDERQRVVMMNPAAERMFGCRAQDAVGSDLARFIPARLSSVHPGRGQQFSASGMVEWPIGPRGRVTGLRANGQEFAAEAAVLHVESAGGFGPGCYYTALLRDLGEEQGLQAELETLQRRFRLVFEMAPVASCIVDDEHIVIANRACEKLFGIADGASVQGLSIYDFFDPDSRAALEPLLARAVSRPAGAPLVHECVVRLACGQRQLEVRLATLPDHGHTALHLMLSDITTRGAERVALEQSRHDLRQLSARGVQAREASRLRVARELHDELGQRLSALKMDLASLDPQAGRAAYDARIAAMLGMLDETMVAVRRIAADLRPLMLDDLGLNAAVEWLAHESARRMGIGVTVRLSEPDPALDIDASIAVYRMVQEALTNVARHARATDVRIELREAGGKLVLTVQDNGVGLAAGAERKAGSFGLLGMRERAYLLGGSLKAEQPAGGGTRITVRLPLRGAPEGGPRTAT